MSSSPLFQSWKLGEIAVSNRIVMAPMATNLVSQTGEVTEALTKYLKRRAVGGCGMIIVESATVDGELGSSGRNLRIDSESCLAGLQSLVRKLHSSNVVMVAQLWHAGPRARVNGQLPVSPSGVTVSSSVSRALETSDIKKIVQQFTDAGDRAARAGFDAVEIHAAHGYLLHHFIDRVTNRRTDAYGGSLEGRFQIIEEIASRLRSKHPSLPLILRLSLREDDDFAAIAQIIEELNFDAVDVRTGFSSMPALETGKPPSAGYTLALAQNLRANLNKPVITGGRILSVAEAEHAIMSGLEAVVLGRPLLADPDWALKAKSGQPISICQYDCDPSCYSKFKEGEELRCVYYDRKE